MGKSILTTIAGIIAAAGLWMTSSQDPFTHSLGVLLSALGTFLTGLFAKQWNVTGGNKDNGLITDEIIKRN